MIKSQNIFVAGHRGMVGSSILRKLKANGIQNIITQTHSELNLINQADVSKFIIKNKPDQIYIAAAKVGGIYANNTYPAEFIYENLMIQSNIINAAFQNNIQKILFLGSSCIYPKFNNQPIKEEDLLSGYLERTNEPYAVAKIAGIKLCESYNRQYNTDYRCIMPTNLYGFGDNYHLENSHVIPALIRRFHEGKINKASSVTVWGSGNPRREFLHVDDLADASVFLMNLTKEDYRSKMTDEINHINVGCGYDISIRELSMTIAKVINYQGKIKFDNTKPDGTKRKLIDSSRLNALGWKQSIDLEEGLKATYDDFKKNHSN